MNYLLAGFIIYVAWKSGSWLWLLLLLLLLF